MSNVFEFVAESRDTTGRSAAKAARRQGKVPAVIYGGGGESINLMLKHGDLLKHLDREAVYSSILNIEIDGRKEKVLLKDLQRHPAKPIVLHADFLRVDATHKVRMHVPVHFLNEEKCKGVKLGGVVSHVMVDVEVSCLIADLPEFIEVDLLDLDIGESLHLSNLVLPEGVEIPELAQGPDHDLVVVQVIKTRGEEVASEEAEVPAAEE
ncbi:50S ribosomal protein L25/general stress protein Ctc [methane-oxidizing endosymbiont of Gigantopelta aegis]|uniref:50S ribosomal protein L25/general stress protein Ctc n=1 Tax=methane-oxidizing endosymbiont of Gigantopelta aegis TaxID=2794938 RepID=UPI0018DE9979|nr:50S ribosomal protein L25/general stress protein Ctc [methane-oxidizing endosymbiont of Gigantopelta aegis]